MNRIYTGKLFAVDIDEITCVLKKPSGYSNDVSEIVLKDGRALIIDATEYQDLMNFINKESNTCEYEKSLLLTQQLIEEIKQAQIELHQNKLHQDIAQLRIETGVGLKSCVQALTAADGDMDKAKEIIWEEGQAWIIE